MKPPDSACVPLCRACHGVLHQIGQRSFDAQHGIDLKALAAALWARSPHQKMIA